MEEYQLPRFSIVIPLHNEEAVLPELINRLGKVMDKLPGNCEVVLVDDGSKDGTGNTIQMLSLQDERYVAVQLSRNFGHAAAITAGLQYATANEYLMIMDGDLQDPPELIFEFLNVAAKGFDVVYGIRRKRKEGFLKRLAYYIYYRILKRMAGIEIPPDSGDFCLLTRRAVDVLNQMPEKSRFVRGMRAWIGFHQTGLEYERDERRCGNSKYSLSKLIRLGLDGIFNFSDLPVRFIFLIGLSAMLISAGYLGYALIQKLYYGITPQGFTGLLAVIVLFSGVQLLSLGVIGEYVLRIFFQTKQRPIYIVKSLVKHKRVDG